MTSPGRLGSGESKLETVISYLLIVGVLISLTLETIGIVLFYRYYGHLSIMLKDRTVFLQGQNCFTFLYSLLRGQAQNSAFLFLALGIATLILTPYLRLIASVIYFACRKDAKYVVITVFVLIALTISLTLH